MQFLPLFASFRAKVVNRAHQLIHDGLWVVLGQLVSAIGALAGVRLLTEFVAPPVFGAVSLYLGVILLGTNLACAPLFQAVLRFYPELALEGKVGLLRATVRRMLWKSTLFLFAGVLGVAVVHSLLVQRVIWIYLPLSAVLILDTLRGLDTNFLSAARRHRPFAIWNAFEAVGRPLGAIATVLIWNASAEAILTGYGIVSALGYLMFRSNYAIECAGVENGTFQVDKQLRQQIAKYALPLVPLAVVVWISSLSDRYVIGGILDLEKVGIYAAAYGLVSRPFLILGNITTLTLRPVYFEAFSRKDSALTQKILFSWLGITAISAVLGVFGFIAFKGWITSALLAEKYRVAAPLMPWIAVGYGFYILANVFEQVIYARKQTGRLLRMHLAVATFALSMASVGVWSFGLPGAAFACPIYFLFHLSLAAWLTAPGKLTMQPLRLWKGLKLGGFRRPEHELQ